MLKRICLCVCLIDAGINLKKYGRMVEEVKGKGKELNVREKKSECRVE